MYFIRFLLFIINCMPLQSKRITNEKPIASACIDSNGLNGTCNFIDTCSYVRQLKFSGRKYYRCGFEDQKEVVCCAKRDIPSVVTDSLNTSRRHVQECEQYKSKLFDTSFFLTRLTASGQTVSKHTSKCSQYTFPLIVGGENARPKEFPHMALLGCKNATGGYIWSCGGSLVSTNYILTAAHCFEAKECEEITVVRLGDLDVEAENDDAQPHNFVVERIIPHPHYNSSLKYNDIGLVKLKTNANITFYIRPACLPYTDYDNRSTLIISGWGSRQLGKGNAAFLQKAPVEEFSHDECNGTYAEGDSMSLPEGIKYDSQICAGSRYHNIDTCYGDSGGPLQTIHPYYSCMYSIIGVTSFGQLCGSPGVPGVYTRVYNYNDWIESIVWK